MNHNHFIFSPFSSAYFTLIPVPVKMLINAGDFSPQRCPTKILGPPSPEGKTHPGFTCAGGTRWQKRSRSFDVTAAEHGAYTHLSFKSEAGRSV